MKLAAWNVNSLKARLPHLQQWCAQAAPDVLALQELKLAQDQFPEAAIEAAGYHAVWAGQKTYNGVALLSRSAISEPDFGGELDAKEQRRVVSGTVAGIRVVGVYAVNGQAVGSEKYRFKLDWFARLHAYLREQLASYPRLVVMGDFNVAPKDIDVHDPQLWHEQVLCSTPERSALNDLLALGLHDSFRLLHDTPKLFSWWDYRELGFRRNRGLRIDLALVSDALRPLVKAAGIDKEPRKWERPSDHAPIWVELQDG